MQLRHISPRSIDWVDAMDEGRGSGGREKLASEEHKLRHGRLPAHSAHGRSQTEDQGGDDGEGGSDDYGWRAGSASK